MRISDWSSDVCSSDLHSGATACPADAGSRPGALLRGRRRQAKLSFLIAPVPCMSHYEGDLRAPDGARFAIIASRWNPRISDALVAGARETFASHGIRSEEHTSELQSLMRISYAVFCLIKKNKLYILPHIHTNLPTTHTH